MRKETNDTERRILETSRKIFNRWGYAGMTLRKVANEVGIEVQSIYNYTPSKQALVERIVRLGTDDLQQAVLEALDTAPDSAGERLLAAMRAHVVHYTSSPNVVVFFRSSLIHFGEETRNALLEVLKAYEQIFKDIIREGIASGEFREVEVTPTAYAMLGMGESITNWWHRTGPMSAEELSNRYADLALRMVINPEQPEVVKK